MNERIKELITKTWCIPPDDFLEVSWDFEEKFAESIVKDVIKELFVVFPGGKNGSDVAFQNISAREWIKQVYGVDV